MRAMIYLEFFLRFFLSLFFGLFLRSLVVHLMLIVATGISSQKLYSCADAGATSSSQIAAALMIDLETVDIRCVGTNRGEYSQMGCSE